MADLQTWVAKKRQELTSLKVRGYDSDPVVWVMRLQTFASTHQHLRLPCFAGGVRFVDEAS